MKSPRQKNKKKSKKEEKQTSGGLLDHDSQIGLLDNNFNNSSIYKEDDTKSGSRPNTRIIQSEIIADTPQTHLLFHDSEL